MMKCLLCGEQNLIQRTHQSVKVHIFHCQHCDLIFKDPKTFLNLNQQKQRYDFHHNNPDDLGYENFLSRFIEPLMSFLKPGMTVLDWGSGPAPALVRLLRKKGFTAESFDPIYFPQLPVDKYSAVVSTEVVEHFIDPLQSFKQMLEFVLPQGLLAGMTEFHGENTVFETWWYVRDTTHVCFYSPQTLRYLAKKFQLSVLLNENNIFILQKN